MMDGKATQPGPLPPDLDRKQWSFLAPVVIDSVPSGGHRQCRCVLVGAGMSFLPESRHSGLGMPRRDGVCVCARTACVRCTRRNGQCPLFGSLCPEKLGACVTIYTGPTLCSLPVTVRADARMQQCCCSEPFCWLMSRCCAAGGLAHRVSPCCCMSVSMATCSQLPPARRRQLLWHCC